MQDNRHLYAILSVVEKSPFYLQYADEVRGYLRKSYSENCNLGEYNKSLSQNFLSFLNHKAPIIYQYYMQNCRFIETILKSLEINSDIIPLCYGHEDYPRNYYWMEWPPLTLHYLGSPCWKNFSNLSVVGSREPSQESIYWIEYEFKRFSKKLSPCIVSGGARGVDQLAHEVALQLSLPTVAILPSGILKPYPCNFKLNYFERVLKTGGCVLSEFLPDQMMKKFYFDHRNRLIAGLGQATLIVESKRRSGTMLTARHAAQLSRPLLVVPGHPSHAHFSGNLDLITEGATLVRDALELETIFNCILRESHGGLSH